MKFVDKNGLNVECTVSEYLELTQKPRLILESTATVTSMGGIVKPKKMISVPKSLVPIKDKMISVPKVPDKRVHNSSAKKRMTWIHQRLNVLRANNHYLDYPTAFQKANKEYSRGLLR